MIIIFNGVVGNFSYGETKWNILDDCFIKEQLKINKFLYNDKKVIKNSDQHQYDEGNGDEKALPWDGSDPQNPLVATPQLFSLCNFNKLIIYF